MLDAVKIRELFKDFVDQITDVDLANKTIAVWVNAARQGGWKSIGEIRAIPFTLLTETRGIDLIEHTRAVTAGAVGLALAQQNNYSKMPYSINMDRLIAGGLLHDVGKLLEIEAAPDGTYRKSRSGNCARHPISGAILAGLAGMPDEIINIIACHAKEGDGRPQVVETVLIHQADFATFDPMQMLAAKKLIL